MRKLMILATGVLLLIVGVIPAMAVPVDDLTTLAQYVPEDSAMYGSIRIDEAYIARWDAIAEKVDSDLDGLLDGMNLTDFLDEFSNEVTGEDFDNAFDWVGDVAAVSYTEPDSDAFYDDADNPIWIIIAINDQDKAVEFWESDEIFFDGYDVVEEDDGILIFPEEPTYWEPTIYITEDAMVIRTSSEGRPDDVIVDADESLLQNSEFTESLARLPLDDYNGIGYLSPTDYFQYEAQLAQEDLRYSNFPLDIDFLDALDALGAQAAGVTILDDRNFVLDIAPFIENPEDLLEAGFDVNLGGAISLDFTNQLPADTPMFVQATDLGPNLIRALAELEKIGDYYDEQWENGELDWWQRDLTNIDAAAVFIRQSLEGLSGLSLEEGLGWMTEDYIVYAGATPTESEIAQSPILPDFGIVVANTGGEAFTEAVPVVIDQLGLYYEMEDNALVIPTFGNVLEDNNADILFGNNGDAVVLGTRNTASQVLAGEGGLADDPTFIAASEYFIEDTQILAYINFAPLADTTELLVDFGMGRDAEDLALVLPLFESTSITANLDDNGQGVIRMVLTLSE